MEIELEHLIEERANLRLESKAKEIELRQLNDPDKVIVPFRIKRRKERLKRDLETNHQLIGDLNVEITKIQNKLKNN